MNLVPKRDCIKPDTYINYFKETTSSGYISIPNNFDTVKEILKSSVIIDLKNIDILKSEPSVSNEGIISTGTNLVVNYSIKCNLKYISYNDNDLLFFSFLEPSNPCLVVVPPTINTVSLEDIISKKLYYIYPYVENIELLNIDKRTLYYHVTVIFIFYPLI